jgi:hypothetical protein
MWAAGLAVDEPFADRAARMERSLRKRRAEGDGPVVGEWDRSGAQAAQSAFEWMGWDGEEPLFLRRYDVQLFVWYVLPRKYLVGLDDKEAVAAALAKTLERLGGQAAGYADVCRAPETERLLHAWEAEDPAAPRTFRDLLDGSGVEPPDMSAARISTRPARSSRLR